MKGWTAADLDKLKVVKSGEVKLPKVSTNALTQQALKVLTMKGYNVWRQPSHSCYDPKKKVFRANGIKRGISDIIGFKFTDGSAKFIAVEIKNGKDKVSLEQQQFIDDVIKAGGKAIVLRKIEDLEAIIN